MITRRYIPVLLGCAAGLAWGAVADTGPATVRVTVLDASSGKALPCRLTLVDEKGVPAEFKPEKAVGQAYRTGVLYTGNGQASFTAPDGKYTLYVTRGMEYGLGAERLELRGGTKRFEVRLKREVDTSGYIAADTHIHTFTYARHGDATIEERMATIAGEGIELAISTEHNHHVDFAPIAKAAKTEDAFTPVIGNEVTTKGGHFNIFPIRPGSAPPDHTITDWNRLIPAMRAVPGVKVITLNHPADNHSGFIPTDPKRFHPGSGESLDGSRWDFDGFEVLTSAALQSDWMRPYRDWFALLNRGLHPAGIGSSDSHDVDRFILGQGRTYVASTASDPSKIDVNGACDSMLAGRVLASMGLLTEMWVDGKSVGETSMERGAEMSVRVRVQGPRWIGADRVEVYQNGEKVLTRALLPPKDAVVKGDFTVRLPRPKHDVWLVAIASGPGVSEPYWPIPRPYQPNRADWDPRVVGSTNFIRVDGDGDGRYSSPYETAARVVKAAGGDAPRLATSLAAYDAATAVQAAAICRVSGVPEASALKRAMEGAAAQVRHGYVSYQNLLVRGGD